MAGNISSLNRAGLEDSEWQVLVCGAGPVGLLCAKLLGQYHIKTLVVERLSGALDWSRAIGVSPPSLDILADAGLADSLLAGGTPIRDVVVHGARGLDSILGTVSFSQIPSPWPFMLSVPQVHTEATLSKAIADHDSITMLRGFELIGLSESGPRTQIELRSTNDASETLRLSAQIVLGCDGMKSAVRTLSNIPFLGRRYGDTFVMGDFVDRTFYGNEPGFGDAAHLFFTPTGAVESFPLPDGKRRWVVQTESYLPEPMRDSISRAVKQRAGLDLDPEDLIWQSPFGVQRFAARSFRKNNVYLLGDAAHTMSPIGGQGMNTGFADAAQLIPLIADSLRGVNVDRGFERWERQRKKAFGVAASRAWRSMRLGTVRGRLASFFRNIVLWIMLNGPLRSRVPLDYAMLTIPHHGGKKKLS